MASQLDIYGGETPYGPTRAAAGADPGLSARLGRKQANRDRIVGTEATLDRELGTGFDSAGEVIDPHTDRMAYRGIRNVAMDVMRDRRNSVPYGPHDAPTFRKAGQVRELPVVGPDAVTTMQDKVHPGRVAEITANPSTGADPRIHGGDRPLAVELMVPDQTTGRARPTDVIWNGNHRVAAAIDRGEMFQPFSSIKQDEMPAAAQSFRRDKRRFAEVRAEKYDVGVSRMMTGDATLRQGLGNDLNQAIVDKQQSRN